MIRVEMKTGNTAKIFDMAPEGDVYRISRTEVPEDGVYETLCSDGWHTVVNYTDADFRFDGRVVPAKDLIQFHG